MFGLIRRLRRCLLARDPFPEEWLPILESSVPFYSRLPLELQSRLRDVVKVFAREKYFTGVEGMEITDEVKVLISACAARLVLHLDLSYYDRLTEIIVYPYIYKHPDSEDAILGEACFRRGTVVLSWPAVEQGIADLKDGQDTALHEFAHVLDASDGVYDGTPVLRARAHYRPWALVMSDHFLELRKRKKDERKVLRTYGAKNEAEFFAVATESYFEKPIQMLKNTPDLYEELQRFYGGDPAATFKHPGSASG